MSVEHPLPGGRAATSLTRHPLLLAAIALAISVVALFGGLRVKLDASDELLMARDAAATQARQAYLQVVREFGSDRRAYFLVREENWSAARLAALEGLHDELARLAFVERVEDIFSLVVVRGHDGQLVSAPLMRGRAPARSADLEVTPEAFRRLAAETRLVRPLVGANGQSLVLGVALREGAEAVQDGSAQALLSALAAHYREQFPSLALVGPLEIEVAFRHSALHDLQWMAGAVLCSMLLLTLLLTRSLRLAVGVVGLAGIGLLWTFGMMGFFGIAANLLTGAVIALVAALCAVRLIRPDAHENMATPHTWRADGAPWAAGVVVVVGLLVQGFAGVGAVRDLLVGIVLALVATGVAGTFCAPLFARLVARQGAGAPSSLAALSLRIVEGFARHGVALAAAALLAVAGMVALLAVRGVEVEHAPLAMLGDEQPAARAAQRLHEEAMGAGVFHVRLDAYATGAFRDPANLQRLVDIQAFIDRQKVFDGSVSLADFVAQAHQEASGGRTGAIASLPANRRLVEQYLVLQHPEAIAPYVSDDFSRAAIVVRHGLRDAAVLADHVRELRAVVAQLAGPTMTTLVSGRELLVDESVHAVTKFAGLTALAVFLAVFATVSLMFTSVFGGALAALASFVPLLVALFALRLLGVPIGMATAVGALFPVMVSVLATVRLFSAYSECCRRAETEASPVLAALQRELAPTLTLFLIGFVAAGSLLLSQFALLRHLGFFLCVAFAVGAVMALCFVPLVLPRMRLVGLYDILALSGRGRELASSPLFAGFSTYQMRKMILLSELREFRNGACVIEQGSFDSSMYLVLSGEVEVVRRTEEGERHVATLGPGEVFGEIGFVRETYRTADVRAIGEVSVLRFEHQRLERDLKLFPNIMAKLNFNICGILGKRLAETVGKPGQ